MSNEYNVQIPWPGWQIVRRLGGGAFGTVYEIERDLFGDKERAALKVMRIPGDEEEIENDYDSGMNAEEVREKYEMLLQYFVREYKLMLELKGHSNIVSCHDFAVVPNTKGIGYTIYIRMELLIPLLQTITEEIPEETVLKIGRDVCKALVLCEQENIIHRDIKPDNILKSEFGEYKLGDFGIARTMEKTMSASASGTPYYMAPEVVKRLKYGKDVDTYSLGLVLYCLLNKRRLPFVPMTDRILVNDMQKAYSLRIQGAAIPEPATGSSKLKAIVLKALNYDREQRYRSAKDMLADLCSINTSVQSVPKQSAPKQSVPKQNVEQKQTYYKTSEACVNLKEWWDYIDDKVLTVPNVYGVYIGREDICVSMIAKVTDVGLVAHYLPKFETDRAEIVLTMPAVHIYNERNEVLVGKRAVSYQKDHKDKTLRSVFTYMKPMEDKSFSVITEETKKICLALMKELKNELRSLERMTNGLSRDAVVCAVVETSDLNVKKVILQAMQEAGIKVKRVLQPATAYAISKSFDRKYRYDERSFAMCVEMSREKQHVQAEYRSGVLEMFENRAFFSSDKVDYHAGDKMSRLMAGEEGRTYDNLAVEAAKGALCQGLILSGDDRDRVCLDIFPWKLGIEILGRNQEVCCPLTWISKGQEHISFKCMTDDLSLCPGVKGAYLKLYTERDESEASRSMIGHWDLTSIESEWKQLKAGVSVDAEHMGIHVRLELGDKTITADFFNL